MANYGATTGSIEVEEPQSAKGKAISARLRAAKVFAAVAALLLLGVVAASKSSRATSGRPTSLYELGAAEG